MRSATRSARPLVARSITLAAMLTSTPSQSEPIRSGGRYARRLASAGYNPPPQRLSPLPVQLSPRAPRSPGPENTAMMPSPIRLTMWPPASSSGGSTACATRRSSFKVASSPAQRPGREAHQVGEDQRHLAVGGPARDPFGQCLPDLQCPQADFPRRGVAVQQPVGGAGRGAWPAIPAADNGSPNSGSPGRARRARLTKAMTPGLRLVFFSHAIGPDDRCDWPDRSSNDSTSTAQA